MSDTENLNKRPEDGKEPEAHIEKKADLDLLRLISCGSAEDGKSTLIGRLLYEAQLLPNGQLATLEQDSGKQGTDDEIDFALLVDELPFEKEQNITIDVTYRYFNTGHRKFAVADNASQEQYTRNMVAGASTADLAIILVDASQGILSQTQRHSFIASLMGIKYVVLAINKMDLAHYEQDVFDDIVNHYMKFAENLQFDSIMPIPLSALNGANIVERSANFPWYAGPTLLDYLETVEIAGPEANYPFRFPVQEIGHLDSECKSYSGTVAAGSINKGELIRALPSGETATVKNVLPGKTELGKALVNQAITLSLDTEINISQGNTIVEAGNPCEVSDQFSVTTVWMDQKPGFIGRTYWLMMGPARVNAVITAIKHKVDINSFEKLSANELKQNDIGELTLSLDQAVAFEPYSQCKALGSFVLLDHYTNATVAAGIINFSLHRAANVHRQALVVKREAREQLNGHKGKVLWFTGLSGSGKSTVANALEQVLHQRGMRTYILDGDNVRHGLNKDLGFTDADRVENIRRISEVAKLMVDAGLIVITSFISPFRSERDMARSLFEEGEFVEVFVNTPLEVAEQRDPKGLYKKARRGELPHFTGIDSDYEAPLRAELEINTADNSVDECVEQILSYF
tara:strand:+ start:46752 stop:48644 length:1893 start_codon:yes stop_codon:yes gene_type:complete